MRRGGQGASVTSGNAGPSSPIGHFTVKFRLCSPLILIVDLLTALFCVCVCVRVRCERVRKTEDEISIHVTQLIKSIHFISLKVVCVCVCI